MEIGAPWSARPRKKFLIGKKGAIKLSYGETQAISQYSHPLPWLAFYLGPRATITIDKIFRYFPPAGRSARGEGSRHQPPETIARKGKPKADVR